MTSPPMDWGPLIGILFFYSQAMSPLFVFVFYDWIQKGTRFFSPRFVFPFIVFFAVLCWSLADLWPDYLYGGAVFLLAYSIFLKRAKYTGSDSFVLALLIVIASDQAFQIPMYLNQAPTYLGQTATGWLYFAETFLTAGWALMAFPLVPYFLLKIRGRIRFGDWTLALILVGLVLIAYASIAYPPFTDYFDVYRPYYLFPIWLLALGSLAYATRETPRTS